MDQEAEARSEYVKFLILLLFFGALTMGAAMLRPVIQGGVQAPPLTKVPATSTLSVQIMTIPTVTPIAEATAEPIAEPTDPPSPTPIITPTAAIIPRTYEVQAGDTLFRIGQQFDLTVEELVAANQITNRNLIRVGQVLAIPSTGAPPSTRTYIVQWGDCLWGISRRFGVDMQVLITANDISDPSKILVGQVLEIPH